MVGDSISNLINGLKNAGKVGKGSVVLPYSKMLHSIAKVLNESGFAGEIKEIGESPKKKLSVKVAYDETKTPKINDFQRVSKQSKRVYGSKDEFKPVRSGYGLLIVSTSKGVMTADEAKKQKVGGELLFKIW